MNVQSARPIHVDYLFHRPEEDLQSPVQRDVSSLRHSCEISRLHHVQRLELVGICVIVIMMVNLWMVDWWLTCNSVAVLLFLPRHTKYASDEWKWSSRPHTRIHVEGRRRTWERSWILHLQCAPRKHSNIIQVSSQSTTFKKMHIPWLELRIHWLRCSEPERHWCLCRSWKYACEPWRSCPCMIGHQLDHCSCASACPLVSPFAVR